MARAPLFTWLKNKFYTKTEIDSKMDGKAPNTVVSSTSNGLMIATDKEKLDTVEVGANKTVVDGSMSATSSNPVQNKTVKAELDSLNNAITNKVDSNYETGNPIEAIYWTIKDGWCIVEIHGMPKTLTETTYTWINLCEVPQPQTNRLIYASGTDGDNSLLFRVSSTGILQYEKLKNVTSGKFYGFIIYPVSSVG